MPNYSRSNRFARAKAALAASFKPRPALSKPAKEEVKKIILRREEKQTLHNGASTGQQILGNAVTPLVNFWQNVATLTNLNAGLTEYQRRGDQVRIKKISLRMYVNTTSSNELFRFCVVRQKATGMTPVPVNPNQIFQVPTPGIQGCISGIQDDQPCQILCDRTYTLGIAAGMQEGRFIKVDLVNKEGWPLIFYDGVTSGLSINTVVGDIALLCNCSSGTVDLFYQYQVTFTEK